jgi:hypothetical protein
MQSVNFEFGKYKLINIIYATLQAAMQRVGSRSLRELFVGSTPQYQQ